MARDIELQNRFALSIVVLGLALAVLPLVLLPESSGPVAFALTMMQGIAIVVGLGVGTIGLYSYRTGNLRPALATGLSVIGLGVVGAVGAYVEMTGGPLIPIWVWLLSAMLIIGIVLMMTYRVMDQKQ